jgi:hypothetical protein
MVPLIRIQEGKNDPQKREKFINFMFLNAGCSLLRTEGFSCRLDVLYGGLEKAIFDKQIYFFSSIFDYQTLDPDPESMNPALKTPTLCVTCGSWRMGFLTTDGNVSVFMLEARIFWAKNVPGVRKTLMSIYYFVTFSFED